MKLTKFMMLGGCLAILMNTAACTKVGSTEVGVRVHSMGSDRGIEQTPLTQVGYYYSGPFVSIETFPVNSITYVWSHTNEGKENKDESLTFSDNNGTAINADIGITYSFVAEKAPALYARYHNGPDEIRDTFLRNVVRDAFVVEASKHPVEYIYGEGKAQIEKDVLKDVVNSVGKYGIRVENIYWASNPRLPDSIQQALNSKQAAVQRALQAENEVKVAQAEAQSRVAKAQGDLQVAQLQAQANKALQTSLTPELVRMKAIEKWNGILPHVQGGGSNFIVDTSK